jgi:adenosine kinase
MHAIICGSVAFDTIMNFDGHFRDQILPDRLHMLNVAFLVPQLRREFGGCAGNIAYNMRLLDDLGVPTATVGADADRYLDWMREHGIPTGSIKVLEGTYTAQAFITTDQDDNQITAFHPGAMNSSHVNKVGTGPDIALGVIAPDGREGMLQHAEQFAAANIPFLFDPGQGLPMFNGEELRAFVKQASWVAVNEYEWHLLNDRTGLNEGEVASQVRALIVTRGAEGSTIYVGNDRILIPPAMTRTVIDPTGCGDAYRAGLLHGLLNNLDWPTTGRVASLMGALKIEVRGTQNHRFTQSEFDGRYRQHFGERMGLVATHAQPGKPRATSFGS